MNLIDSTIRRTDSRGLADDAPCLLRAREAQEQRRGVWTPPASDARFMPSLAEHGMVVAQEKIAAEIGADVLKRGGNAVDAAVATGFAMAVTYPRAGNIGGGGFMVIHSRRAPSGRRDRLSRDRAGGDHAADIFLGPRRQTRPCASRAIPRSASACPAPSAGLALALEKYGSGKFTLADLLRPAIDLARDGIVLADDIADTLPDGHERLARWPASAKIFSRADGTLAARGRPPGADRSGGRRSRRSPSRARADFTRDRSRKSW